MKNNSQNCINNIFKINFWSTIIPLFVAIAFASCLDQLFKPYIAFPNANDSISKNENKALRFFALSDWGFNGSSGQKAVAAEMNEISVQFGVNFILTCGDNFQYQGVKSITDTLWKLNYETIYIDSALKVTWYPSLGNHDYYGNPDAEIEYSQNNKTWNMPSQYYSFSQPVNLSDSVLFVVLDTQGLINDYSNLADTSHTDSIKEISWLKSTLAESHAKWVIVTGHHPVFSASTFHGDTYEMKKLIKPIFDQYKVDLYICGHDHHFEHATDSINYTDYIVTGTGGSPRPIISNSHSIFTLSELGFTYVVIEQSVLKLYFITSRGKVGYSYTKTKL